MNKKEIKRVENFDEGDVSCVKCGKVLHLYYNGGEMDEVRCCGLIYRTEIQKVDLVVYEPLPEDGS